jgi:type IV pilus assembly protein PilC
MPVFEYVALDAENRSVVGREVAPDRESVDRRLRARGLRVERLAPANDPGDPLDAPDAPPRDRWRDEVAGPLLGRVALPDLFHFFRQLGALLEAGIGAGHALSTAAIQTGNTRLREIAAEASRSAMSGATLSSVFDRYPYVFGSIALGILRVGEASGRIDVSCAQIADHYEREHEIKRMIQRDTLYPKLLLVAAFVIICGANLIIGSLGGQPLSSPLASLGVPATLVAIAVGWFLFTRVGLANKELRSRFEEVVHRTPGVGKIVQGFAMARFGAALGALYGGGVPLTRALQAACDASGAERVRSLAGPLVQAIERGEPLTPAMRATRAFPETVLAMVQTGEETGKLDTMLTKVSEYYLAESHTNAKQLATLFGVAVMLGVAIYLGYIIISFWAGYGSLVKGAGG